MTKEKKPLVNFSSNGFTLIETAIVVVISAIMLAGGMVLLKTWMNQASAAASQQRLNTIQQALVNFEAQNSRLPCPASFTAATWRESTSCTGALVGGTFSAAGRAIGTPAGAPGTVPMPTVTNNTIIMGALPVRDLGLSDSYIGNNYGYAYTYAVTQSETSAATLNAFAGVINVVDDTTPTPNSVLPLASDGVTPGTALFVVVDHGKDGKGTYTTSGVASPITCGSKAGLDNNNCDHYASDYFRSAPLSLAPGASWFDDTIVYNTSLSSSTTAASTLTCLAPIYSAKDIAGLTETGLSTGWNMNGFDSGGGFSIGAEAVFLFFFADDLTFGAQPSATLLSPSPTADAYCPDASYHVVSGGCTQVNSRKGAPAFVGGALTNAYGLDIYSIAPGVTGASTNEQIILPPQSHPALPNAGVQGWECNGSNALGMQTQAYVVCCKGG